MPIFQLPTETSNIRPDFREIIVESSDVLALLGMAEGDVDKTIDQIIKDQIDICTPKMVPTGAFIFKEIAELNPKTGVITIEKTELNIHRIIASQLKQASRVALFLGTIGDGIESYSKKLMKKGDYLEGYIVDMIGSILAESMADILHNRIKTEANKSGLQITNRYSPGYCGWKVEEQFKLFRFFNSGTCTVTLNSSALMHPIKSVSGIIGIGNDAQKSDYICNLCNEKKCIYRHRKHL